MCDPGNLFSNIPEASKEEVFEVLHKQESVTIERILSYGQQTPTGEWYDQETDEWVLVVKGTGVVHYASGENHLLKPGDYLFIPKHQKHRVTHTDLDTIWLAIHMNPE